MTADAGPCCWNFPAQCSVLSVQGRGRFPAFFPDAAETGPKKAGQGSAGVPPSQGYGPLFGYGSTDLRIFTPCTYRAHALAKSRGLPASFLGVLLHMFWESKEFIPQKVPRRRPGTEHGL